MANLFGKNNKVHALSDLFESKSFVETMFEVRDNKEKKSRNHLAFLFQASEECARLVG